MIGKDLVVEEEYSNAKTLYSRCISIFKNMPKKQKESLDEEQNKQRDEILSILYLNCAHCLIKKKMYKDGIKAANEALIYIQENPKAYYRIAMAYKSLRDFDKSMENFKTAIRMDPNDKGLRDEYAKLLDLKNQNEKKRFEKVSGFLNTNQMKDLEEECAADALLREKLKRQIMTDSM